VCWLVVPAGSGSVLAWPGAASGPMVTVNRPPGAACSRQGFRLPGCGATW